MGVPLDVEFEDEFLFVESPSRAWGLLVLLEDFVGGTGSTRRLGGWAWIDFADPMRAANNTAAATALLEA